MFLLPFLCHGFFFSLSSGPKHKFSFPFLSNHRAVPFAHFPIWGDPFLHSRFSPPLVKFLPLCRFSISFSHLPLFNFVFFSFWKQVAFGLVFTPPLTHFSFFHCRKFFFSFFWLLGSLVIFQSSIGPSLNHLSSDVCSLLLLVCPFFSHPTPIISCTVVLLPRLFVPRFQWYSVSLDYYLLFFPPIRIQVCILLFPRSFPSSFLFFSPGVSFPSQRPSSQLNFFFSFPSFFQGTFIVMCFSLTPPLLYVWCLCFPPVLIFLLS